MAPFDQSVVTRRCVLWKRNSITDRGAESWLQLWRRSGMQWDAVVFTKNIWGGCTSARCKNPRLQTVKDSVCWDYCSQFSWVSRATHLWITINYINDLVVVKCQFMSSLSPFDIKSLTRSQINPEFQSQRASKILAWRNVKIDLIIEGRIHSCRCITHGGTNNVNVSNKGFRPKNWQETPILFRPKASKLCEFIHGRHGLGGYPTGFWDFEYISQNMFVKIESYHIKALVHICFQFQKLLFSFLRNFWTCFGFNFH